jgi:hypothetical protein
MPPLVAKQRRRFFVPEKPNPKIDQETATHLRSFALCRGIRIRVFQNRGKVDAANRADGMIEQSPGVDRGIVGKDASFQNQVNAMFCHPSAPGSGGATKQVRTAQLRAIE